MATNADDSDSTPTQAPSGTRSFWKGIGEVFAFIGDALIAGRDLVVRQPPLPLVPKGEDVDPPSRAS